MHKNLLWQAFLAVVFLITLWYTGTAAYRYYFYSRLTERAPLVSIQWNVKEKASDQYIIEASYRFSLGNESYFGTTTWPNDTFRNSWAAEMAIKQEYSQKPWKIWFDPSNPNHSSLQKRFPFKESISAGFLWILFFYFFWLGFYVAKRVD